MKHTTDPSPIRIQAENERWEFIVEWSKTHGLDPRFRATFDRAAFEWAKLNCSTHRINKEIK